MKVVKIQFHRLDKEYFFLPEFSDDSSDIQVGDFVVVDTSLGQDIGQITGWDEFESRAKDNSEDNSKNTPQLVQNSISDVKQMTRKATEKDLQDWENIKDLYHKYLTECRELCRKLGLKEMKLIDAAESFDRKRLTFYFVSDSRVDFRDLVKELVRIYHKKIRLQQVGVRDATKICGGFGPCGLPLCCSLWLEDVGNVSPDFIKDQELSHRGADRLTGPCGRLKCCLRFEEEAYKYNLEKMPKEGDIIKTGAGRGRVVSVHPMKHTVELEIDGARVEYPYLEGKLCEKSCSESER
ncbi:hypothetical protein KKH39_02845 [Patescibacteria group bacterium]|nr:hypothetical protein [Patescibacteria group bacterium]